MRKNLLFFLLLAVPCSLQAQINSQNISKTLLLGKLDYVENPDFVKVSREHASKTIFLNREVYSAFTEMYRKAQQDGIDLQIVSGARNFDHQKAIWERKWKHYKDLDPQHRTQKILEYSSMPTTSRHHWGTDIDLNDLENSYFESGKGKLEYDWLVKNAAEFGFYQVYTSKESGRTGYAEEKWHWSYLPLANRYLQAYNDNINYEDITGFAGADLAEVQKMIPNYVNGVSHHSVAFSGNPETRTVFNLEEE